MKSLLSRKFSRSLSSLVSPSRSHQDNILSLPDYYRDTRREIYGPYWSTGDDAYCPVRTMELPYVYGDESYRNSFLLDIGLPGEEGEERKTTCCLDNLSLAFKPRPKHKAPFPASKKNPSVGRSHQTAFRNFLSLFCGRNHAKN